jgi:hypothetical protein
MRIFSLDLPPILRDGPTALLRMRIFSLDLPPILRDGPAALLRMRIFSLDLPPHPEERSVSKDGGGSLEGAPT